MFKFVLKILPIIFPKKKVIRRVLTFHSIDEKDKYSVTSKHFENIILSLLDYNFVFPDNKLSGKTNNEIAITFDDGRKSVLKAASILDKYNIKATFYIITSKLFDEDPQYLNYNDINFLLSCGHSIGSHSHTHKVLSLLDEESLQFELEESKNILCKKFNLKKIGFAIPYGQENTFNNKIIEMILLNGYEHVSTQIPGNVNNIKIINRSGINKNHSVNDIIRIINGKLDFIAYVRKAIIFIKRISNKTHI